MRQDRKAAATVEAAESFSALFVGRGDETTHGTSPSGNKFAGFSALFVGRGDETRVAAVLDGGLFPVSVPSLLGAVMRLHSRWTDCRRFIRSFSALFVGRGDETEGLTAGGAGKEGFSALFVGRGDETLDSRLPELLQQLVSVPSLLGAVMRL